MAKRFFVEIPFTAKIKKLWGFTKIDE